MSTNSGSPESVYFSAKQRRAILSEARACVGCESCLALTNVCFKDNDAFHQRHTNGSHHSWTGSDTATVCWPRLTVELKQCIHIIVHFQHRMSTEWYHSRLVPSSLSLSAKNTFVATTPTNKKEPATELIDLVKSIKDASVERRASTQHYGRSLTMMCIVSMFLYRRW